MSEEKDCEYASVWVNEFILYRTSH